MSTPLGPHDVRTLGASYTTAFVPGGAIGYLFQSYLLLCSSSYADLVLSLFNVRKIFNVSIA